MFDVRALRRLIRLPWRSRARIRRDIDDEFQFHLDMRVAELEARGLTLDEARREAMRRFGDVDDAREYCRTMDERSTSEQHRRDWLTEAYGMRDKLGKDITDDAQLVEATGQSVYVVEGAATNIKITTRHDLFLAEAILKAMPKPKVAGPAHPFAEEEMWGGRGLK